MRRTIYIVLGLAGVLFIGWMIFGRVFWGATLIDSGFDGKTLWDWLELLIIPLALAVFGFWTNFAQTRNDREIAEKERETDREIERDRQQQNTLDRYFDKMGEFFKEGVFNDENKKTRKPRLELVKSITVVTISDLDSDRNGQLFRFLQEVGLISTSILQFQLANLSGANLGGAILVGTDFGGAILNNANLGGANLYNAQLSSADLTDANLKKANLIIADLVGTKLIEADLSGADLTSADLSGADLTDANLREADLVSARLVEANLKGADLSGAHFIESDLKKAFFNEGTIMPDGSMWHENYFSDQVGEAQD